MVAAGRRHLPRGWSDLGLQLGIWFGFAVLYQLARGLADRNPAKAFSNGQRVFDFEIRVSTPPLRADLRELRRPAAPARDDRLWTYWNSEFTVVGLAILFVYVRRHAAFIGFRNAILLANVIGLAGYIFMPTAPPRLLGIGFVDQHRDGLEPRRQPVCGDAEPPCR